MPELVTPYTSQDLFLTRQFDDDLASELVSRGGEGERPFPRKIDLWWCAVMIGAAIGQRTPLPSSDSLRKFNTGAIFGREPWRVSHLELLAFSDEGEQVVSRPSDVIRVAHEYAFTGLEWLMEKLRGTSKPTLTLMTSLEEVLPSGR